MQSGTYDIRAVYSRSKKSAGALIPDGSIDIYSDDSGPGKGLDDLLARKDIQAVDVVLPISHQPEVIKKSLKAGKHVVLLLNKLERKTNSPGSKISEKPVGATITQAEDLISFYKALPSPRPVWSVAEQFRHNHVFDYTASLVPRIGKFSYFVQQVAADAQPENKYALTAWRKTPDYQGGFLLDGGVHFIAGLRKILPSKIARVSAFTRQNRQHLPPADTLHATVQLADGATGIYGNTAAASRFVYEIELMGQEGYILVSIGYVEPSQVKLVLNDGTTESKSFPDANRNAIAEEFRAFAKSISEGVGDARGSPEEALVDLAIIEYMLTSGDKSGEPIDVKYS